MTLPFVLPTFNTTANIWRSGNPTSNPPDVVTPAQLYFNSRAIWYLGVAITGEVVIGTELRVPKGTDLQKDDVVECAAGLGEFYDCLFVERVHLDFANEYFMGLLSKDGVPVPSSGNAILMEGGDPASEISAMPSALSISNADLITIVQGGANFQSGRNLLFSAAAGEDLFLQGYPGQSVGIRIIASAESFSFDSTGQIVGIVGNGWQIDDFVSGTQMHQDGAGNVTWQTPVTAIIQFTAGGASDPALRLDGPLGTAFIRAPNGFDAKYNPATPANWIAGVFSYANAIDRIAAQLVALIGGPIP